MVVYGADPDNLEPDMLSKNIKSNHHEHENWAFE